MRYLFAPFLVALSFLTLLPVGVANPTDAEISRSRGWYPFVGLLYGVVLVILVLLLEATPDAFPRPLLTAALLVTALALLNRFLHLDGLMDFCDAMWGGRTVERRLEIMRDSRVGSFAVAGCFCVLLIKFAALSSLVMTQAVAVALLTFPVISRWSMALLLTAYPYGRQQGIGSAFFAGDRPVAGDSAGPADHSRRLLAVPGCRGHCGAGNVDAAGPGAGLLGRASPGRRIDGRLLRRDQRDRGSVRTGLFRGLARV